MCGVVEAGRKICVPNESRGCRTHKVREGGHRTPGIGSIDEGERQRVQASRKYVVARRWDIARVFVSNDSRSETCRLKRYTLCEGIAVVSPESLSALSPVRGILSHPFARRIRHANTSSERRSRKDARIQIRLVD